MDKTLDELVRESRSAAPSRPVVTTTRGRGRGAFRGGAQYRGASRGGGGGFDGGRPRPGYPPAASRYNPIAQQRPNPRGGGGNAFQGGGAMNARRGGRPGMATTTTTTTTHPQRLIICDNCMGRGHIFHNCTEPLSCFACGDTTHEKASCPVLQSGVSCTYCGKLGHSDARCKTHALAQWRNEIAANPAAATMTSEGGEMISFAKRCYCCGSTEHEKVDCPSKTKTCDKCGMQGHLKAMCRR